MMEWRTENSSVQPEEFEKVNADTYIQRRNIRQKTKMINEEEEIYYESEYRFISESEYNNMITQKMMSRITQQEDNQIVIMQAIADLYELQTGGI